MTDRELMQQALYALESMSGDEFLCNAAHHNKKDMHKIGDSCPVAARYKATRETLRARLAQPEQEPVAWWHDRGDVVDLNASGHGTPLYFAPPQREWKELTDDEIEKLVYDIRSQTTGVVATAYVARAIEAKLKEKNNG